MSKLRVALIGAYPPPYGGVSIHIKRLKEQLEKHDIECIVYDNSGMRKEDAKVMMLRTTKWNTIHWLLGQLWLRRESIIHYHGYDPTHGYDPIVISILSLIKRRRILVTLHSFRYDNTNISPADKLFFSIAKRNKIIFIVVGTEIKSKILSMGIKPAQIKVIPAFIPPTVKEREISEIPQGVWQFVDRHTPVISASASKIVFYNNQDLYGLDMCIDLCAKLKQYYPRIGLVFALPYIGDYEYFTKMKREIKEKGIEENFLFQTKSCQLYPILMKSRIFVRPTNTDGDAISIREALYFGVPSITSDIVVRPKDVILFKNRDVDDFILKVKDALDNYTVYKDKLIGMKTADNAESIIRVYKGLIR